MTIFHVPLKPKKKKKLTKAQQKLADEWTEIKLRHSRPLEKGAKAQGLTVQLKPTVKKVRAKAEVSRPRLTGAESVNATTVPIRDPLREAKAALKHRVGQVYPKGAPQYLIDLDLEEQKTGAHKRR